MTSKPNNKTKGATHSAPKARTSRNTRRRRPSQNFSTEEKVQAVLAAWTEKLSQTEICRQMQINYATFQSWQNRAMEGMMQALENHLQLGDTSVLNPRLRKLMEKGRSTSRNRLDQRLKSIQQDSDKAPKS